jgi:hypothetical protein
MTEKRIREILASVASGKVRAEAAFNALKDLPFEDLGFAKLDSHRTMRRGVPEVVFGENKTVEQMAAIGARVVKSGNNLIITRLAADKARVLKRKIPRLKYLPDPRIATVIVEPTKPSGHGSIMVISAGGTASADVESRIDQDGERAHRGCRNGRRATVGRRGAARQTGRRGADQRRLRNRIRRHRGAARDAEHLFQRRHGSEH